MEIELKLSLPATAIDALKADPLLAKARKTRKRLDNIYFDTPDRALAQARIGLRLRKDGRRWLQTVKSGGSAQAGLHQREEIEFAVSGKALEWAPLAGTKVEAVLEPIRQQLCARFRTLFTRDIRRLTGPSGAKIELAIDQGEIIAGKHREAICELELELLSGSADDLFDIALELASRHPLVLNSRSKAERGDALAQDLPHGALGEPVKAADLPLPPDADAPTAARLAVENCLTHWQANEAGFLAQPTAGQYDSGYDSEYLHQLRVGIRRLRVACDPFARLAGWQAETLAQIKEPLRKLGQQLGAARDWDVFIEETWPTLRGALEDAAARTALQEEINLRRDLAHQEAHAALESRETQRALLLLSRCLAGSTPADDAADRSFDLLNSQLDDYRHTLAQGLQQLKDLKPERLHALRIIAKKIRYLTEFTASRYDAEAVEKWLKWLKKAQDVFGSRNDRRAATARIDGLCKAVDKRHGKIKRTLHAALETRALPELDLAPLPEPYWL
jgi:triphosphatase